MSDTPDSRRTPRRVSMMDTVDIDRALSRVAHEILEKHGGGEMSLVGIRTRGVPIAQRLAAKIGEFGGHEPPIGLLDINLYRDDLSHIAEHPILRKTEIPFKVDGSWIVLVDDVLFTGRTIRAALEALLDLGRPRRILLAVLVDRGHRELPIRADFVGKNVPTSRREAIEVRLGEIDDEDEVLLVREGRSSDRQESSDDGGDR
jgi:pyrimidine operon attenuation protein/uracil phosphoribosyltransferase